MVWQSRTVCIGISTSNSLQNPRMYININSHIQCKRLQIISSPGLKVRLCEIEFRAPTLNDSLCHTLIFLTYGEKNIVGKYKTLCYRSNIPTKNTFVNCWYLFKKNEWVAAVTGDVEHYLHRPQTIIHDKVKLIKNTLKTSRIIECSTTDLNIYFDTQCYNYKIIAFTL